VTEVWYATREMVMGAPDVKETAYAAPEIDRALGSASEVVEKETHRRFYPRLGVEGFDWPQPYSRSWRLWLDGREVISVDSIVSGGVALAEDEFLLRRSDGRDEPPYTHIEIDLSRGGAWSAGSTHQNAIQITGLWGYRNDEKPAGALAAAITTTAQTQITVSNAAAIGVGSLIRIDDERMIVTEKRLTDTGQDLGTSLTASGADVIFAIDDASGFTPREVILVDAERMLIVDIAGNNLIVKRAVDGSTLAAHSTADIYALRSLTVERGVLGTTAATHLNAAPIARHEPPSLVRDLTIALALNQPLQESSGYARTSGSGENAREFAGRSLAQLRRDCVEAHGRRMRARAV
jgi:hypothetical protein